MVDDPNRSRLSIQLAALTLARWLLSSGLRMVYPFAPALARGMGVPLTAVYRLITIRNFTGLFSPLFGPLSERFGRKPVVIAAMGLFSIGCLLLILRPAYWLLGVTLSLIALAKVIYDPAMQAYVGDSVPYEKRGWAIAVTEFSWAGALLAGAPLMGLVIQRQGWQAPFFWLGALGAGAAVLLWRILPRLRNHGREAAGLRELLRVVRRNRVVWAAAAYMMLFMGANEVFFLIYGDWMESSFGLALTSLGLASSVVGGAEIMGELFAGWSVDRFGKRPVIIATGALAALTYAVIPRTSASLVPALITLFMLFLFFEITFVGGVPLFTEVMPNARGVVMSLVLAAGALGRALGALLGPMIWERWGFIGNGLTAAVITLLAVLILSFWIRENAQTPEGTAQALPR